MFIGCHASSGLQKWLSAKSELPASKATPIRWSRLRFHSETVHPIEQLRSPTRRASRTSGVAITGVMLSGTRRTSLLALLTAGSELLADAGRARPRLRRRPPRMGGQEVAAAAAGVEGEALAFAVLQPIRLDRGGSGDVAAAAEDRSGVRASRVPADAGRPGRDVKRRERALA